MTEVARLSQRRDGVPVFAYHAAPHRPPVTVLRGVRAEVTAHGPHIHDFPVLWYEPATGVVSVVATGAVVDPSTVRTSGEGAGVLFDPGALGSDSRSPWPSWQSHPLLFPFLHGRSGGLLQLAVPQERQPLWDNMIRSIEAELDGRRDGYRQAALAHLTLLLIDLARLADDVGDDLRRNGEPLLAEVFEVIDRHMGERLSLRDVADAVGLTPGHLTTLVRRRTGRTVGEWIIERRMARARQLLTDTDLPVAEIATRVGVVDPGYFSRQFRTTHGASPRQWRHSH